MIPYGKQTIDEEDINAVVEVLRSDWITQGPKVPLFEAALCEYTQAAFCSVVNSGTSALHLACLALDLQPGDTVWTSPITFVASANCARYCGASVEFVDVNPESALIDTQALEQKLIDAEKNSTLPRILIVVHFAGQSCEMKQIKLLAERFHFRIIEDAAHALGGQYVDNKIGSCQYSDITVFSFHPVKMITTGEGGACLTNIPELAEKMELLRSHGVTRDSNKMTNPFNESWYYEQIALGYNYRMTDIQAALGHSQMKKLDQFVSNRIEIANYYDERFYDAAVHPLKQYSDRQSSYHLYVIRIEAGRALRDQLHQQLRSNQIMSNLHYIPLYYHPYWQAHEKLQGAEQYFDTALTLPIYPLLQKQQLDKVISLVISITG